MTRPESDTSASEAESDETIEAERSSAAASREAAADERSGSDSQRSAPADSTDPDALFDELVAAGVLDAGAGSVRTTDEFEHTHGIYYDSYVGVDDAEFRRAVASAFGLPDDATATELVDAEAVTREDLARYLAVRSHAPDDVPPVDLAVMTEMVGELVPDTPVPAALADVTDDPASFVAERDRAVVTVWKRFCDPCESLKADLDAALDAIPDEVAVGGIDGEVARDFCETYGVDAAPGVVLVRDGDHRTVTGGDESAWTAAARELFEG
ncbi:thioredoxin domain-containing protein [Halorussus litoreus]|uniref:thioredoxin domain-containing protein n=1 Tax=Halorussus litoreus TaxID=1710536 RepID=UPI000E21D0B0|nr:thioredoxin family protein [Halorussus litoreus]